MRHNTKETHPDLLLVEVSFLLDSSCGEQIFLNHATSSAQKVKQLVLKWGGEEEAEISAQFGWNQAISGCK